VWRLLPLADWSLDSAAQEHRLAYSNVKALPAISTAHLHQAPRNGSRVMFGQFQ
jgi:hypothetical protein